MASITQALRTAQSGLLVNQQTLNVVANNIANVNTDGYSRKIVSVESQVIAGVARQRYPGANNESQAVHEHHSISLPPAPSYTSSSSSLHLTSTP